MKKRLPVLITARLGSSRLPRKHLLYLASDKSAIVCLIERLRRTGLWLVLCIPEGREDMPLRHIAITEKIDCFAGDPDNVLRRYSQAMSYFSAPAAGIVDADDVFVSTEALQHLVEIYSGEDVIRVAGMAYGAAPYLLSHAFVDAMLREGASPNGWSAFLDSVSGKKLTLHEFTVAPEEQAYRLSLDYPEDLDFLGFIYQQLAPEFTHADVIAYITANRASLMSRFPALFDGSIAERAHRHLADAGKP
jgi:spore coat polysaccharide biosynthesis protein SpsF (cytidylyltransferase family)